MRDDVVPLARGGLTGPFHLGVGVGVAAFDLAESAAGTLLQFSFRAIGVVDADLVGAMSRAFAELVRTRLKALVETGTRLGIDPDEPPGTRSIRPSHKRAIAAGHSVRPPPGSRESIRSAKGTAKCRLK